MGMNLNTVSKMLRCTGNDDIITLKVDDGSDTVTFMFKNPNKDKIVDFEMKLMNIDSKLTLLNDPVSCYIEACHELKQELGRGEFGVTYLYTNRSIDESLPCKSISKKKL